ncbi:thiamine-monophosphate kinase [Marmoricola sp. OAE513]|uniref:thiamine-phosphate kinase n=1 Tax=Marmoricola sp. OAE513 TaxID=2817894 RepID=UPI001AE0E9E5
MTSPPPGATVADLGEFGLIQQVVSRFEQGPAVFVGPGDDAALLRTPKGHVVVSTDLLVENRHFRRDWAGATDVGHRAAAQNLSDINAMGGTPTALTLGLTLPPDLEARWVLDLADGVAAEAALVGASVIGGDITRGTEIVIAVTVLGECTVAPVLRSGARPGDVLAIAGRQGWAAAGLAVLGRGFRSPRAVVLAHQRPEPPYAAGPLAAAGGATSMIDVSDGLVADVGHLAHGSGVRIDVWSGAFDLDGPLQAVGAALGVEPISFVLGGGEDHALVATFPGDAVLPEGFRAIGAVLAAGEDGPEVTVDGEEYEGPSGWTHF